MIHPLLPLLLLAALACTVLAGCATAAPLEAGFGRATLWGTWKTDRRQADDFEVRVLAVRGPSLSPGAPSTVALVAVADLGLMYASTCERLRTTLASELKIPREHIGIFCTQNHGGEYDGPRYDYAKLDAAFLQAARQAVAGLTPAEMAAVAVTPQPPLVQRRRVTLEGVGNFTFYFGWRPRGADPWDASQADASHMLKQALASLLAGEPYQRRFATINGQGEQDYAAPTLPIPVPEVVLQPPANDPLLQGLFFRDLQGRPVGALVRFPSHPNVANLSGRPTDSGDYPVYVRRRLEEAFGGTGMFMTGPCGDQASAVGGKSLQAAESYGTRLADEALQALASATHWQRGGVVAAVSPEVELRIRADFPVSVEEAKKTDAALRARIKMVAAELQAKLADADRDHLPAAGRQAMARAGLAELKRLSDQWELVGYVAGGALQSWIGMDLTGKAGQTIRHPLFVLRIGATVLAGLPGEPFGGYSAGLRRATLGENLIVCEEGNGYLVYLPTAQDVGTGGYEPNATLIDATAEDTLTAAIRAAVDKLIH